MVGNPGETRCETGAAGPQPQDPATKLPNKLSQSIGERARRVIWKGGKEATQHESLRRRISAFLARAEGCKIWDVDGNCYTDYLMTWGTVLLGHVYPAVESEVARQLARGSHFNLAVEEEVILAERLVHHIPGAELVRFLATGAEATGAAVRIARAATGREMVLQYGFHGWLDWCQRAHPAGIPPATVSNIRLVRLQRSRRPGRSLPPASRLDCLRDHGTNQRRRAAVRAIWPGCGTWHIASRTAHFRRSQNGIPIRIGWRRHTTA